jgi:alcohol dehydrogenase
MMALIEDGSLQPQRLVERTIGLEAAAALLPEFDTAKVSGMTIVDPTR